ncbi:MAG: class II D-tagatose-bisphosphate aldolase non-catalytic subunit [Actinomycetes bacterium]
MTDRWLDEIVAAHRIGETPGMTSICSAHPMVVDQSMRRAAAAGTRVLLEATCNQVNQDGGYTGMTPADFRTQVLAVAERVGLPTERLLLGGDHLGPNPWRHLPAEDAMARAEVLVAAFASSGFTKLHLDTSMRCADDPSGPLHPAVVAERAARLAGVGESSAGERAVELRYVIGTEVPVPGGEASGRHGVHVSDPADIAETVDVSRRAFVAAGLEQAWARVRAIVAQPGVEFSNEELFGYRTGQAAHLYESLPSTAPVVFEAHSTDYQDRDALRALVRDHFAILKVGPGLTFAFREAVFGLAEIESQLLGDAGSQIRAVLDRAMVDDPQHWVAFYPQDPHAAAVARRYSRSDRSRYYWPVATVEAALDNMTGNLTRTGIPDELASQHLSWLEATEPPGVNMEHLTVERVLRASVDRVLDAYDAATSAH